MRYLCKKCNHAVFDHENESGYVFHSVTIKMANSKVFCDYNCNYCNHQVGRCVNVINYTKFEYVFSFNNNNVIPEEDEEEDIDDYDINEFKFL